jgi:hypothetical protein
MWMDQVFAGLEPQLPALEALPALQLQNSLRAFHLQPPAQFSEKFQARLVQLIKKFDAMGIATLVQGLVACGINPSLELQQGIAQHVKKGLARPSQGMGGTPVWILLGSLLQAARWSQEASGSRARAAARAGSPTAAPAAAAESADDGNSSSSSTCPELLEEVLLQVASQLSSGAVSSSRMCRQVLPALAAAIIPGGCWGPPGCDFLPSPRFCAALCDALVEFRAVGAQDSIYGSMDGTEGVELSGLLWLGLLVMFGGSSGFTPPDAWVQAASEAVLESWAASSLLPPGSAAVSGPAGAQGAHVHSHADPAAAEAQEAAAAAWQEAPASQFAAWLAAVGRLQHEPAYLPGYPDQALARLQALLWEMNGHELSVSLLGLAQQQQLAEVAVAGVLQGPAAAGGSSSSGSIGSSRGRSMLAALAAVKPELLAAAEEASLPSLHVMDAEDLATLAHAMQQLDHTPSPAWASEWQDAVERQLPGCSPAAAVLQLVALAGFSARPSGELLQGLVCRCQVGFGQLQLQELLGFTRALLLLGYKLEPFLVRGLLRAGQAAAATAAAAGVGEVGRGSSVLQSQMLLELQRLAAGFPS